MPATGLAPTTSVHVAHHGLPRSACINYLPPCLTDPQIFSRTRDGFSLVEERQEMPSLKEVALEVLPRAAAAAARR